MSGYADESSTPERAHRIAISGADIQRQVAIELAELLVERTPRPLGREALAALRAGEFGDSSLRRALETEAAAAKARCEQLDSRRAPTTQVGQAFRTYAAGELAEADATARFYKLLAAVLDSDPLAAAEKAADLAQELLPVEDVERAIDDILESPVRPADSLWDDWSP